MKAVILLCLVGAALAAPGGYTGLGGVYKNMKMKDDVMSHAMKASKHLIIYNAFFYNKNMSERSSVTSIGNLSLGFCLREDFKFTLLFF